MGLGRRTFAPGEVLTASNVMNYLQDQVVMNFAGTAARGSAIGTAVQQGMVSYLNNSNTLETYNGTTWNPIANISNVGLIPVVPTSITPVTGSASTNSVGKVSFTGCTSIMLNGVFTSTYESYFIRYIGRKASSNDSYLRLRFATNGTALTSGYSAGFTAFYLGGSTIIANGATTSFPVIQNFYAVSEFTGYVNRPRINGFSEIITTAIGSNGASQIVGNGNCEVVAGGTFDGIQLYTDASTLTGIIQVFGITN